MEVVSFFLPKVHKLALWNAAAYQGVTASQLLRNLVESYVMEYRGGIFFERAASDLSHKNNGDVSSAEQRAEGE